MNNNEFDNNRQNSEYEFYTKKYTPGENGYVEQKNYYQNGEYHYNYTPPTPPPKKTWPTPEPSGNVKKPKRPNIKPCLKEQPFSGNRKRAVLCLSFFSGIENVVQNGSEDQCPHNGPG